MSGGGGGKKKKEGRNEERINKYEIKTDVFW
jgi:hypothetical protein